MTPLVAICLLLSMTTSKVCTAQATTAAAGDCSCPLANNPVCTNIGITVANECLATCQGLQVTAPGTCAGDDTSHFAALPESFAQAAGASAAFAVGQGVASKEDINRFSEEGFFFSRAQQGIAGGPVNGLLTVNRKPRRVPFKPGGTRVTPNGYVYVQSPSYKSIPATVTSTPAQAPDVSAAQEQVTTSNGTRRLLQSYSADDRFQLCAAGLQMPYSAVGRMLFKTPRGTSLCSGTMVAQSDFLTAGHCVWNVFNGTWNTDWSVAPAYYNGQSPFGTATWSYVTVFRAYQTDPACKQFGVCGADIAVIRLNKIGDKFPGQLTGWKGIGWECGKTQYTTQTCGYPGESKNTLLPWCNFCNLPYDCKFSGGFYLSTATSCTVEGGQSGSGQWTSENTVRAVLSGAFVNPTSIQSGQSLWPVITKQIFEQLYTWTNANRRNATG